MTHSHCHQGLPQPLPRSSWLRGSFPTQVRKEGTFPTALSGTDALSSTHRQDLPVPGSLTEKHTQHYEGAQSLEHTPWNTLVFPIPSLRGCLPE